MKKLFKIIGISVAIFGTAFLAFAAPYYTFTRTMVPEADNAFDLGTTTARYRNLFLSGTCTGCSPTIGGTVTSGVPDSVLFVGGTAAAPTLSQNPQFFQYSSTTGKLLVTSTRGAEKVVNPNPNSATSWTLTSPWAYSSQKFTHASNGTGSVSQAGVCTIDDEYLVKFTILDYTTGGITAASACGVAFTNPDDGTTTFAANGTYTIRIKAVSTGALTFTASNTSRLSLSTFSITKLSGGTVRTGFVDVDANTSNTTPGTTRHMTFSNAGANTYIDFNFAGVYKTGFGAFNTGQINSYHTGANGWNWYTGIVTPSLFSQNVPATFYHTGDGRFGGSVRAGSASTPTSILQTSGSLGLEPTLLTTSTTLTGSYTEVLCDGANTFSCTGTPSSSCAGSANQTACELYSRGCTWNAGSSCSAFDNEPDMGTCAGTSGCTVATSGCSGGDETTCLANDDAYGGSCSWSAPANCVWSDPDCSGDAACDAGDNTDQSTCEAITYGGCSGNYNTGSCTGSYGASCSGTASCSPISGANCVAAGCSLDTALNLTLPSSPPNGRTYLIKNVATSSAACYVLPNTGQDIEGGTSMKLENYKDATTLAYYARTASCSEYNSNESLCGSTSGCTKVYYDCGSIGDEGACNAQSANGCSWNMGTCEGGNYASCSGSYSVSNRWYELADRKASTTFYSFIKAPYFVATTTRASIFPYASTTGISISSLTATRIPYAGTGGFLVDSSAMTFNGTKFITNFASTTSFSSSGTTYLSTTDSILGIGTTSPFANLSVNPIAGKALAKFVVGSSTATSFFIGNDGKIGIATTTPNSTLSIGGSLTVAYAATSTNYAIGEGDYLVDFVSGTVNATLPTAVGKRGREYVIKNSGTGVITINTTSSQTIDGVASGVLTLVQYDSLIVISNGANWIIK